MLVPYIMELKAPHDFMASETKTRPYYGNDTVKHFLTALIQYMVLNKAQQLKVVVYQLAHSRNHIVAIITNYF